MSESSGTRLLNIALVADPVGKAGIEILTNVLSIYQALPHDVYVITGNFPTDRFTSPKIHVLNVTEECGAPKQSKVLAFLSRQLKLSLGLAKILRKVNIVVAMGLSPAAPVIVAKIFGKKVVRVASASLQQQAELDFGRSSPLYYLATAVERLMYAISDKIITFTPASGLRLDGYKRRISCAPLFVDTQLFKPTKSLKQRENLVGYIGRLEKVKGVMNLAEALPLVLSERRDVRFLIVGDGTERHQMEAELHKNRSGLKTTLTGWVPYNTLPDYFNELKLLVLPSYSEGLPTVVLQAMACGTPVLVTPVGGVAEVVRDGSTGFILPNNSPDGIARNIIRALEHPELEQIANNAREVIEQEYIFQAVLERYKVILDGL